MDQVLGPLDHGRNLESEYGIYIIQSEQWTWSGGPIRAVDWGPLDSGPPDLVHWTTGLGPLLSSGTPDLVHWTTGPDQVHYSDWTTGPGPLLLLTTGPGPLL